MIRGQKEEYSLLAKEITKYPSRSETQMQIEAAMKELENAKGLHPPFSRRVQSRY